MLVRSHRNAKAARCFLGALVTQLGKPRDVVTDKLRSYTDRFGPLLPMLISTLTRG
ncbi:hypothetical protein [Roseibium aggregatum]|uniref:hypothetical protein n=1 Tax=Roseibium aggregatum TaxID=187304 RepID=UPI003A7F5E7A